MTGKGKGAVRDGLAASGSTPSSRHDAAEHTATPLPEAIPERLRDRLKLEGVTTCEAWRALGRRRMLVFGIPRSAQTQIDLAMAEALGRRSP